MSYENGNFNNNNDGNNDFRARYFSPVMMKNENSQIDPSELSFTFWKNLLGIVISPKKDNTNTTYTQYDHDNNTKIYINHTRARILYEEMKKLKENPDAYNSVGVNSGTNGIITVCNGKEVGVAGFVIIIRKIDQDGTILSSFMYEFKRNYHYAIENFDETSLKYDKSYYDDIEYDEFMDLLYNYYTNASGFIAASVVDANRFNHDALYRNLTALMANFNLNPVSKGKSGASTGQQKSFFDMAKQGSQFASAPQAGVPERKSTSLEELAGEV